MLRPTFRSHEIPFLTTSSVSSDCVISLDDLFISVRKNEIVLRSRKLNKRVIPRLSCAHNFGLSTLPVYRFLCDLQNQGYRPWIGFSWGNLSNSYAFTPRVIYRNLIFCPAQWIINKVELINIFEIKVYDDLLSEIKNWRITKKIPEKVLLVEGDNKLFIDLANCLSVKTLLSSIKRKETFVLEEFLFNPKNSIVTSVEGENVFTNEFLFAFHKENMSVRNKK
jgi:hypothetical protein